MLVVAEREQLPVAQARAGEPDAWGVLFKRYQLPLYVYVFELVHDEQTSLDLVQETFIAATQHLGSLRDNEKFGSWLFGVAHQKCLQRWRKQSREEMLREELAGTPADFEDSPDDLLVRQEQEVLFMKALNRLPLPQRSALLLHFLEGFSLEDIAGVTGVSVGTVKSRLHYGKEALRALLEQNRNEP
jgi:RNA polymerase sigma-70 factor, ECF subfamily